jgi:hypothetical protein
LWRENFSAKTEGNRIFKFKFFCLSFNSLFRRYCLLTMEEIRVPIEDDKGYIVRIRFQEFLQTYRKTSAAAHPEDPEKEEEITQQMYKFCPFEIYFYLIV